MHQGCDSLPVALLFSLLVCACLERHEQGWQKTDELVSMSARHTAGEYRTVARAHTRLRVVTDADIDDFYITRG